MRAVPVYVVKPQMHSHDPDIQVVAQAAKIVEHQCAADPAAKEQSCQRLFNSSWGEGVTSQARRLKNTQMQVGGGGVEKPMAGLRRWNFRVTTHVRRNSSTPTLSESHALFTGGERSSHATCIGEDRAWTGLSIIPLDIIGSSMREQV
jgi:hypothetical protein